MTFSIHSVTYFALSLLTTFCLSCQSKTVSQHSKRNTSQTIKYATGFEISKVDSITTILIKNPYLDASEKFSYNFSKSKYEGTIQIPLKRVVVTSTTHIPMLELLNQERALVGFPHTSYVSSLKTRALIEQNMIKDVGQDANLNTEILLNLNPEAVVAFSMQKTNKSLNLVEQHGIPVLINGDWLEETPLGRAEWIKFFGVLFDKEKEADSIFKRIEQNYLNAKKIAKSTTTSPTILSGAIMQKDIWSLPAGDSFVAQYLKDANTNYLWQNTSGKGSLSLSFETVLDKAQHADIWVSPGYFNTAEDMLNQNPLYEKFRAFNNIYSPNLKKGATGGVLYYELGPTRPDLVLKDLIKIAHPEVLPDYNFTFFEKFN